MTETQNNTGKDKPGDAAIADSGKSVPETTKPSGKKRLETLVTLVFYLSLLCAIGYIGFMLYEQQKAVAVLFEQQNAFSSQRNTESARMDQVQSLVQGFNDEIAAASQESLDQLESLRQAQAEALDRLQNELVSTRLRIATNNPGASQEWLLAEAASLLRLAQQHLVVAKSVRTAQALFIAADDVLKQIDDPAIFSVREILAGELAAIRSVPEVDVEGIYAQLGAVADQVATLQVNNDLAVQLAEGEAISLSASQEAAGMVARFFGRIRSALDNYFIVRRRDVPIQPLMTPAQEAALMQSVLLQIEQGKTALLREEQLIYSDSLGRAHDTINRFLSGEPSVKADILATLEQLGQRRIVTEAPPLALTRAALEQILSARESQSDTAGPQ